MHKSSKPRSKLVEIDVIIVTNGGGNSLFNCKPTHPTKMYYIDREQSFENWPQQLARKPRVLIQNGFFYMGIGDRVTCFYCNVTLRQWDRNYCIETKHLKWEPNCLQKWFPAKSRFLMFLGIECFLL